RSCSDGNPIPSRVTPFRMPGVLPALPILRWEYAEGASVRADQDVRQRCSLRGMEGSSSSILAASENWRSVWRRGLRFRRPWWVRRPLLRAVPRSSASMDGFDLDAAVLCAAFLGRVVRNRTPLAEPVGVDAARVDAVRDEIRAHRVR